MEVGRDGRREGREIGPHVGQRAHAQAAEFAVVADGQLGVGHVVAAVGVGEEGLAAVGGPLHRTAADPLGGPEDQQLLRVMEDLGAEAAAHVRRHHPQLVLRHLEGEGAEQQAGQVGVLRRGVERVAVLDAVVGAVGGARLDGVGSDPVVGEVERDHLGGVREFGLGGRGVAQMPVEADVAGRLVPDLGGAVRHRGIQVSDGRPRLVVDLDEQRRVLGLGPGLGDHHGDRIAGVAGRPLHQGRVGRRDHLRAVLVGDHPAAGDAAEVVGGRVLAGQHGEHARRREGLAGVDRADLGVGVRRAHEHGMGLLRQRDVVGIPPLAHEEAAVLLAQDGSAHALIAHWAPPRIVSAAVSTALTML